MQVTAMVTAHRRYLTAAGYAANTIRDAAELLLRVDADLPFGLAVASAEELVGWLAQQDWTTQTRKTYRNHLRRFFKWAADSDDPWISFDPSAGIPSPKVAARLPRPATDEQVRRCCHDIGMPWRLHCRLAAYAGLRSCEIARLAREQVDPVWLAVERGKGGKDRRIPTHPLIWQLVEAMPPGPLARRPDGSPASPEWVSKRTAEVLRREYRIGVALYNLRHWYGTNVQVGQGDLRVTQELMGHSSPATTAIYTQVSDVRLRAAIQGLPDIT